MSCLESIIRFKLQWFKSRECVCLTDHTVLELLVFDRENSTRWRDDRWDKLNYKQYQTEMINTLILTTINDLLTFLRRSRSHVIFQIQRGAGWACEDYRCSNHRQPRPCENFTQSSLCSSAVPHPGPSWVGTPIPPWRHLWWSSQIFMLAFVCVILMILILDQLIFNKDTNVTEKGKHRCSTVCTMILYTGKSYGCYEWRHTIYACNLHNCLGCMVAVVTVGRQKPIGKHLALSRFSLLSW